MATKKNVIVGAASVFIGPSGVDKPAVTGTNSYRSVFVNADNTTTGKADGSTSTGVGTLITNWRDVGYTNDGLEVSTDPSYTDIEVDQLMDAVKIFKDSMGLSISTSFAEATLENLLVAWGQANSFLVSTATEKTIEIEGGALGDAPLERGLIAIGNGPEKATSNAYTERTYHAYRVLSVEGSSHSLSKTESTIIPVTFRGLPADTGKYGIVRDRLNVA